MTTPQPVATVTEVGTVFVPVSDQERALAFYVDALGFEKRSDFASGDGSRWIEVAPRGSSIALALVSPAEGTAAPTLAAQCALATDDIDGMVERLRRTGRPSKRSAVRELPGMACSLRTSRCRTRFRRNAASATPTVIGSYSFNQADSLGRAAFARSRCRCPRGESRGARRRGVSARGPLVAIEPGAGLRACRPSRSRAEGGCLRRKQNRGPRRGAVGTGIA